jgi:hypothetical protein
MFSDHVQWFGVEFSAGGFIAALTHGAWRHRIAACEASNEEEGEWERQRE